MPRLETRLAMVAVAVSAGAAAGILGACGEDAPPTAAEATAPAGSWSTWVIDSPREVTVPWPPEEGSQAEAAEIRALRSALAARGSDDEAVVARWGVNPAQAPWIDRALEFVSQRAKDPPFSSRAYAYVAVAMYDAAIASDYWQREHARPQASQDPLVEAGEHSYPDSYAAIAGAAQRVLAHLFPEQSAQRLRSEAEEAARSRVLAGASTPADVRAGLELGREVGDRVITRAKADGIELAWDGRRPPRTPEFYDAPPGSAAEPVQPRAGEWRTWVIGPGDRFRAPPPPRYGSAAFDEGVQELLDAKRNLTDEQRRAALFWAGGEGTPLPAGIWLGVITEYLSRRDLSLPEAGRVYALAAVAMADAGVSSWDSKYHYWYPRPENAVRDSGADPDWKPLIPTPFFPAYTSGHATYSGAVAEVLSHLFPADEEEWDRKAREAADARIWGGIHWPWDSAAGLEAGRSIGRLVVARAAADGARP